MKFKLYANVALNEDIPKSVFKKGDIGTLIDIFEPNQNTIENGYAIEMFNALGDSLDALVLRESQIHPISEDSVMNERLLEV